MLVILRWRPTAESAHRMGRRVRGWCDEHKKWAHDVSENNLVTSDNDESADLSPPPPRPWV